MIIETAIINALRPELGATYYGTAPQPEGDEPTPLPVTIVNRPGSKWLSGFCGTDPDLTFATVQVDYYAATAQEAREMADAGRALILALEQPGAAGERVAPILENEMSLRDDVTRSWRVMQQWAAPDYSPNA